jgi:hypothetical protein
MLPEKYLMQHMLTTDTPNIWPLWLHERHKGSAGASQGPVTLRCNPRLRMRVISPVGIAAGIRSGEGER